jgi:hypothetical protein
MSVYLLCLRNGDSDDFCWVGADQLVQVCKALSLITALLLVEKGQPLPVTLHLRLIALEVLGI